MASDLLNSTFKARAYPEVIWVGEEPIMGPFCIHCGNPWLSHSATNRCPKRPIHPLVPPPSCNCHRLVNGEE